MNYIKKCSSALMFTLIMAVAAGGTLIQAQNVTISGEILAGFGSVTLEEADTTSMDGIGEATLNFAVEKGPISAQVEIIFADSTEDLDTIEHEIVWSPLENLSITISGSSFGIASTDEHMSVVNAPVGQVGDEEANLDFADLGLINVEFNIGALVLGLALADDCVPECGYGIDTTSGDVAFTDQERMTSVLHLRGEAGPIGYNLYATSSSGSYSTNEETGSGSGLGFGLGFANDVFSVNLDYSGSTIVCNDVLSCTDDITIGAFGVAIVTFGIGVHYVASETKVGDATLAKLINIDAVYLIEFENAAIGPEYRTVTSEDSAGNTLTDTFILFGMSVGF